MTTGNYGLAMVPGALATDFTVVFDSKEDIETSHPPELEVVLAPDVVPGSIGAAELAPDAVSSATVLDGSLTGADVADDSLGAADIGAGAIGSSEIADNAVTSAKVANESLTATDIADILIAGGNTAIGSSALRSNTTGGFNTANGREALRLNTTGNSNTAMGYGALHNNTTGSGNTAIGFQAGVLASGSNNIYVSNFGSSGESNTIRIGRPENQRRTFIAGITGIRPLGGGVPVLIDFNGQLGTASSARRFKDEIRDMEEASSGLLRLRPVTFRYKDAPADGLQPLDYGLVAEEVEDVYPDLVAYAADGQVETVQYQKLVPMLLNELQKQHRLVQDLTARIGRLEALQAEAGMLIAARR